MQSRGQFSRSLWSKDKDLWFKDMDKDLWIGPRGQGLSSRTTTLGDRCDEMSPDISNSQMQTKFNDYIAQVRDGQHPADILWHSAQHNCHTAANQLQFVPTATVSQPAMSTAEPEWRPSRASRGLKLNTVLPTQHEGRHEDQRDLRLWRSNCITQLSYNSFSLMYL